MPHALHQYGPGSQDFRFRSTQRHSVPKMTATLLLQIKINHVRRTTHATNKHRMKKLGDPLVENLLENLFETDHLQNVQWLNAAKDGRNLNSTPVLLPVL